MKGFLKNIVALLLAGCVMFVVLAGCNKGITDFHYKFDYAYVYFQGDLVVEGAVEKWWDYEGSDMVQVQIGGKIYLTHSSNILLIGK